MGQLSTVGCLLFFLWLNGICTGFKLENCTYINRTFKSVYSVPGDMAMLSSTLVSSDVFNFTTVPYNITWYNLKTGREMSNQTGRILVHRDTLWFLNITVDDIAEYLSILRTPSQCYRQWIELVVDFPFAGQCGRPKQAFQPLTLGVTDKVSCPLKDYISKLDSYNITSSIKWYRGCDLIVDGTGKFKYMDTATLKIERVEAGNNLYTCTLSFTLGGITGSVSETIEATVSGKYSLTPQVREPANETIKAQMGSNFSKRCLVFVQSVGRPSVEIVWWVGNKFIHHTNTNTSNRIYTPKPRLSMQDVPKGAWLEVFLIISELREEDFHINYTCRAVSDRGTPEGYFTLLPTDPNIILPIGSVLGGVTVLFIIGVTIYYLFKVDIVLWFRKSFPVFYANTDLDGKLYDAYVAYAQPCAIGFSKEVEEFALCTLPQVLENACGYKLFIGGRDCMPGKAIVESVEENIQASRRLLLLYTASTFISKRHTSSTSSNNNNISMSSDNNERKTGDSNGSMSFDVSEEVYPDSRQQLECVAAMHRALLEGSLKVILVELEEISPAQLALFPESVRHLRKKQGAVCWWKNLRTRQSWRTCARRREDEEKGGQDTQLSPSLSPSSRFWKEMRYSMPVRGKRAAYPEKTALLNL
ncbi:interleukin-1 receptor type 1-like isoform X2 [Etheostoma cragini]|nr:interleukin-1 receptor type 1-like isoform X2 [Etheostoma cragini]